MTAEDLALIFSQEGLYILEHQNLPGATNAVLSMGGKAFQISFREDFRLSPDINVWTDAGAIELIGGPFTAQTVKQAREAVTHMKNLLVKCSIVLTDHRNAMRAQYKDEEAVHAQNLLNDIAEITANELPANDAL